MARLAVDPGVDAIRTLLSEAGPGGFDLAWLGQAGFLIRAGETRIVIDPYLSDSLAKKYAGALFPHKRMTPVPIDPARLAPIDFALCTHGHTDHMDPESLAPIAAANPLCRFVVPAAERAKAIERGVLADRLITIDAGDAVSLTAALSLTAIPSAHEELKQDAQGRHYCLGFALRLREGPALYHSGDCVPFPGLEPRLKSVAIDLALLPVNGRDEFRRSHGVPGNFTLAEAAAVCEAAQIPDLIAHHFGMFAENTIDRAEAQEDVAKLGPRTNGRLAELGAIYSLRRA